jgi:glycosyltransferase involved in cell wall biosynthesis
MIGIVVPAHNEEARLGACLRSLAVASGHPDLAGEIVRIVVVLDRCSDASAAIAAAHGVHAIAIDARSVGVARALGVHWLLAQGVRWIASTDADSRVDPSWVVDQLSLRADAVCGTVAVDDWACHGAQAPLVQSAFRASYLDCDGHTHIHGANLGVCARAYERAGGFPPVACQEDVGLVRALERIGARIAWSARPRVTTSARPDARARGGFGDTLLGFGAMMTAT